MTVMCMGQEQTFQLELFSQDMPQYVDSFMKAIEGKKIGGGIMKSAETIKMNLRLNQMSGPIVFCCQNGKDQKKIDQFLDIYFENVAKWEKPQKDKMTQFFKKGQLITYHRSKEASKKNEVGNILFAIVTSDIPNPGRCMVFGQCRQYWLHLDSIVKAIQSNADIKNRHIYASKFQVISQK